MPHRIPPWLLVLFAALLATGTDEFVIAGVLPEVAESLDVTVSVAGQLVTAFAVVYALGAPTLAVVLDRLPRRLVLGGGLVVFTVANAAAALAPEYWTLMASRIVAALAAASVTSAAFATAASGAPEGRQGSYLSVVTAGMTVALFTGVPLGTLLGGLYGWRATFWLIAAVGALSALGVFATAPRIAGSPAAPLADRLSPLRSLPVARLVTVTFLCGTGGLMFYNYIGPFTTATVGGGADLRAGMLLIVGLLGLVGALFGGRVSDALGPHRTLKLVVGGHLAALILAGLFGVSGVTSAIVLGVLVALWSTFAWSLNPPMQGSVLAAAPQAGMTAMALNISGLYLGTGVGGAIGGVVVSTLGASYVPFVGAVLMLVAFSLTPRVRQHATATPTEEAGSRTPVS
ncbi:Predicted arabinose efflux permease, MFS family [Actinopolyspora alba]|uniref:Predicted arabinose efflux permease, MFS family n=1 Tax=Actinopolyspora alba TaxID=673379 RepID=A0A1I1XEA9_9ACTN|nr:MFS transporter [Actinopolyspora alba]SFE05672.1 Predicted arabinose efflux permease, MFS family [Actinopolyspora alba]